jgi:hypothetical protein
MIPSARQHPPTPQPDQQLDLPALESGAESDCIVDLGHRLTTECNTMEECRLRLNFTWSAHYRHELSLLRSPGPATWARAKERSWSSTASQTSRDFILRLLAYRLRAMFEKNQCALEQIRAGSFTSADPDKPERDYMAEVRTMIQGCLERSTRAACEHFLQKVWNRLMLGYALRRVVEAWTRQVEQAVQASGMFVGDVRVRAAARKIELRTLNRKWCQDALDKIDAYFQHRVDHIPESIVTELLAYAPRLWTDKAGLSSFEQSSMGIIKSGVIERQSRDDFIAGTSVVANRMGIDLRLLLDGEPCIRDSAGHGTKTAMERFKPGAVKCHARICADRTWKAELVNAYWGKIADQFKMQDEVRALAALSPSVLPQMTILRDCSESTPAR